MLLSFLIVFLCVGFVSIYALFVTLWFNCMFCINVFNEFCYNFCLFCFIYCCSITTEATFERNLTTIKWTKCVYSFIRVCVFVFVKKECGFCPVYWNSFFCLSFWLVIIYDYGVEQMAKWWDYFLEAFICAAFCCFFFHISFLVKSFLLLLIGFILTIYGL